MSTGQLDAFKLFKVFRSLLDRKANGVLTLRSSDSTKEIHFANGFPVTVRSNSESESLGKALVIDGLISSTEHRDVQKEADELGLSFEEHLLSKDLVARPRLSRLETKLAKDRILDVFGWSSGDFKFTQAAPTQDALIEPLHPVHLILESCVRVVPTPVCKRFLDNFKGQRLVGTSWLDEHRGVFDSLFKGESILSTLDRGLVVDAVASLPGERQTNIRQAAALILGGLATPATASRGQAVETADIPVTVDVPPVDISTATRKQEAAASKIIRPPNVRSRTQISKAPQPVRPNRPEATANESGSGARATAAGVPMRGGEPPKPSSSSSSRRVSRPTSPKPPRRPKTEAAPPASRSSAGRVVKQASVQGDPIIPADMPDKDRGFLEEALGLMGNLKKLNHFELLGVEQTATTKLVRHEFRKLARKFHVDRFSRYDLTDPTRAAVQNVFIALNRAHEVLTDTEERKEYELSLEYAAAAAKRAGPSSRNSQPKTTESHIQDALQAEKLIQVALAQLGRGEAAPALGRLKQALSITPDDPNAVAGQAYAQYLISQSQGASRTVSTKSEQQLRSVIAKSPQLARPRLYLGRILRDSGHLDEAIASFHEALKLDPHLSQATSELRYAIKRKQETNVGIKGFFGRKK